MIISIDGHAGSGKTTIAKRVARKLCILHINTGAMYRAVTLYCMQNDISPDNSDKLSGIFSTLDIQMKFNNDIFLNGIDITNDINSKIITNKVSVFSAIPEIREIMLSLQREIVVGKDAIVEGRDIGTKVFPNAEIKFFFTANINSRAERRQKDFLASGEEVSIEKVIDDLQTRDFIDSNREVSPLKIAEDAIIIDTTSISIQKQVNKIVKIINNKRKSLHG